MLKKSLILGAACAALALPTMAQAQDEDIPYIGEMIIVGFSYCPSGWQEANGALLSVTEYQPLFSLFGYTYGGNGSTLFAVPDLSGRAIVSQGQGPGLSNYTMGQTSGQESLTLTTADLASHTHTANLRAFSDPGNTNLPPRNTMAAAPAGTNVYSALDPNVNMNAGDVVVQQTGGGAPIETFSPRVALVHCIATVGIFPG